MKVITLNSTDFDSQVSRLANTLPENVDLIISVLTGGGYLVDSLVRQGYYQKVNKVFVKLQRKNTKKKENKFLRFILRILPYPVLNFLRSMESAKVRKSIARMKASDLHSRNLIVGLKDENIMDCKTILILDDAIDTGKTAYIVKNELQELLKKEANIFVAVISWTIPESILKPNYYLYTKVLVRFPWSKDYKGKDFECKSFSC